MLTPGQNVELADREAGGRRADDRAGTRGRSCSCLAPCRASACSRASSAPNGASPLRRSSRCRNASPDRRAAFADPACGGCVYSHIAYPRQLDAQSPRSCGTRFFASDASRSTAPIPVAPSPERGYRMRARFHVDGARVGFYREGTHTLCDAAATGQVSDAAREAVASAVDDAGRRRRARRLGRVDRERGRQPARAVGRRRRRAHDRGRRADASCQPAAG